MLVEDSVLLREGLIRLFAEGGHQTLAALGDATDVVATVQELQPDVVVLDNRLPPTHRDEGIRAAIAIRTAVARVGILVLSQYVEGTYARELLAAGEGHIGYLLKDRVTSLDDLSDALRRIHAGETVLDPAVVTELLARDPMASLTPREREVLELMAQGRTNAAIADMLVVGLGAVEKHVSSIFSKLGLHDSGSDHRRVLAVLTHVARSR